VLCGLQLPMNTEKLPCVFLETCVFIRGSRVKRVFWINPQLHGAAESQLDTRGNEGEAVTEMILIVDGAIAGL
jgi:hypothetical protein